MCENRIWDNSEGLVCFLTMKYLYDTLFFFICSTFQNGKQLSCQFSDHQRLQKGFQLAHPYLKTDISHDNPSLGISFVQVDFILYLSKHSA